MNQLSEVQPAVSTWVSNFSTAHGLSTANDGARFAVRYPDRETRSAVVRGVPLGYDNATGSGFLISNPDGLCLTVYGFTDGRCTSAVELWVRS